MDVQRSIAEKIPEDFKRNVVACIVKALGDDRRRYMADFNPVTQNQISIGDWINTNICDALPSERRIIHGFKRRKWEIKVVVDHENLMTYNVMKRSRLMAIRREPREYPNYLQTIVAVLNDAYESPYEQISFFECGTFSFEDALIGDDFREIFGGLLSANDGYTHGVITYETNGWELSSVDILFLDKNLNPIEEVPLNDYIKPDYAALTQVEPEAETTAESKSSSGLLSLKQIPINLPAGAEEAVKLEEAAEVDTAVSPTQLREFAEEA